MSSDSGSAVAGRARPLNVLVYSTFPPKHCGIASYAEQHVQHLRSQGCVVSVMAPDYESSAEIRVKLESPMGLLRAIVAILVGRFDEIHVHYTRDFFFPQSTDGGLRRFLCLALQPVLMASLGLRSGANGSLIFHEALLGLGSNPVVESARACGFALFSRLIFHTATERNALLERYPRFVSKERTRVEAHERYMQLKFIGSRDDARRALGVPLSGTIFLCIGFVQANKAFHLAIEAMRHMPASILASLYVVGSLRISDEANLAYREKLRQLASGSTNVVLVEKYVDDIGFDQWITAADAVILPYQEISSSSVGARAQLVGRPMIINKETHLQEQFAHCDELILTFSTVEELAEHIDRFTNIEGRSADG